MKKPAKWSRQVARSVLAMHDRGKRLRDITAKHNLHHSQVQQFLRWNSRQPHPKRFITGGVLEDVVHKYKDEEISARQIALAMGISDSTVRDALHSAGVKFRSRETLTKAEQNRACRMYRSGIPYPRIASILGCSPEVVRDTLHRRGIKFRLKRKLDPRTWARIRQLYEQKLTPAEIGTEYKVTANTIRRAVLDAGGVLRGIRDDIHRSLPLDIHAFDSDSEDTQYWVGFAITDGSVNENGTFSVGLQIGDIAHLYKLRRFLRSGAGVMKGEINAAGYKPGAKFARLSVCSKPLVESLKTVGVIPRKTGSEELLKYQYSRHTWRGAIDGDGSLGWHKRGYFWIKLYGSKKLCEQFREYVLTLVPGCRAKVQRSGGIFCFGMCCAPAETVARELYRDCSTYLTRKHRIVNRLLR